jgi:tetratricopeptide (TPR) repeat protein
MYFSPGKINPQGGKNAPSHRSRKKDSISSSSSSAPAPAPAPASSNPVISSNIAGGVSGLNNAARPPSVVLGAPHFVPPAASHFASGVAQVQPQFSFQNGSNSSTNAFSALKESHNYPYLSSTAPSAMHASSINGNANAFNFYSTGFSSSSSSSSSSSFPTSAPPPFSSAPPPFSSAPPPFSSAPPPFSSAPPPFSSAPPPFSSAPPPFTSVSFSLPFSSIPAPYPSSGNIFAPSSSSSTTYQASNGESINAQQFSSNHQYAANSSQSFTTSVPIPAVLNAKADIFTRQEPTPPAIPASTMKSPPVNLFSDPFPLHADAAAKEAAIAAENFILGSSAKTLKTTKNGGSKRLPKTPAAAAASIDVQRVKESPISSSSPNLPSSFSPPSVASPFSSSSSSLPSNAASVGSKKLHSPEESSTDGTKKLHFPEPTPIPKSPVKSEKTIVAEARQAFAAKEFAVAQKRFSEALALNQNDAKLLSNRAACSIMLSRHDEAVEDCQKATSIDPTYSPAYQRCARAFLHLGELFAAHQQAIKAENAAITSGDEKDIVASKKLVSDTRFMVDADTAALAQSKSSEMHKWSLVLSNSDHMSKSIPEYAFSISTATIKARALLKMKKPIEASEVCAFALPIQLEGKNEIISCRAVPTPTSACCAVMFAMCVWAAEDPLRALRILAAINRSCGVGIYESSGASALHLRISAVETHRNSGNDHYKRGNYAEALLSYKRSLAAASGKPIRLPDVLYNDKPWPEQPPASLEFTRDWGCVAPEVSLSCFTSCANIHANLAAASMALKDFSAAVEYTTKALLDCPNHTKSTLRRARANLQLNRFAEAINDFKNVISYLKLSAESIRTDNKYLPAGGHVDQNEFPSIMRELQGVHVVRKEKARRENEAKQRQREYEENARRQRERQSHSYDDDDDDEEEEDEEEEEEEDYGSRRGNQRQQQQRQPQRPTARTVPPRPTDYYKILGVSSSATTEEIKIAFRKAALLAHPDKGGSKQAFQALNEAHTIISNPHERESHDKDVRDWIRSFGGMR